MGERSMSSGVAHDREALGGGGAHGVEHDFRAAHALAVLADEADVLGQRAQVRDGLAVEVLRDGDALVDVGTARRALPRP